MQNIHCIVRRAKSDSYDAIYYKGPKHLLMVEWLSICSMMSFEEGDYDDFDRLVSNSGLFNRLSIISREFLINNLMVYASSTENFDVLCAMTYLAKNISNMGFIRICNEISRICDGKLGSPAESFTSFQDLPQYGVKTALIPGDTQHDSFQYDSAADLKYLVIPKVLLRVSAGTAVQCFNWVYLQGVFSTEDFYDHVRLFALKYTLDVKELRSAVCTLIIQRVMLLQITPNMSFRDILKKVKEVPVDEI